MAKDLKNLKRLETLLSAFDSEVVQPEELSEALEAVMTVIESANRELDQRINKSSQNATGALSGLENRVSQATSELQALIQQVKAEETTDKAELRKMVAAELLRIESKIPQLPEQFDATELYNDIQSHKEMLTGLSDLIVGENIRNALEALPEGEKLVMEAIEGLPELLEKLSQMEGKGNVVGGVTRALVEQLIAESGGGSSLPDQTGNAGKFLNTDGTDATWESIPGGGDMLGSNNLSDVANAGTSRTNLGLGTAATQATGAFATAAQGSKADSAQQPPSEGAFVDGDKTKLDAIEASADVTDATNVQAAGALMDSEVTNLAEVKAFDSTDYAAALGVDDNYVTDAEKTVIGNTSGTNTGDQDLSALVSKTGNETVAGVKTFSSSPIIPAPTTDLQAATKKYVDDNAGGGSLPAGGAEDDLLIKQSATDGDAAWEDSDTHKIRKTYYSDSEPAGLADGDIWVDTSVEVDDVDAASLAGVGLTANAGKLDVTGTATSFNLFNVKAYGAEGDGTTDDTDAFDDTVTAISNAGGGVMYVPAGVYIVDPIEITNNTTVCGDGIDVTIIKLKPHTFANSGAAAGYGGPLTIKGTSSVFKKQVTIENLTVDGNVDNLTFNYSGSYPDIEGIQLRYAEFVTIQNTKIINAAGDGIDMDDVRDCIIDKCHIIGAGKSGVHVSWVSSSDGSDRNIITNNLIIDCGKDSNQDFVTNAGIDVIQNSDHNIITSNVIRNNGLRNLNIVSGGNNIVANNISVGGDNADVLTGVA